MGAAAKIMRGLKEALAYSRCRHEFTYWEPKPVPAGCTRPNAWTRVCTECKVRETRFAEVEPEN